MRDPRSLALALGLPLMLLLLFGYALTLDVDRIPTLIYDADNSPQSRDLVRLFQGSRYFQILGWVDRYEAIERKIDSDECLLGVVIRRDYSRKLLSGEEAEVQLLLDGSDSNTASIALGYAEAMLQTYALELRSEALNRKGGGRLSPPVEPRLRVWYNSELKSRNYIVPGLIAVILMIIAAQLTSLTIAREWEMGTMEQLLSTPLRPAELVLGKLTAFFALGLIDMVVSVVVGVFIFRVPLRGNAFFLFFTACIFLFGALCWGIMLSARGTLTVAGLPTGHAEFFPAGLHTFRVHLLNREHAGRHSDHHSLFSGTLLCHHSQGNLSQRCWDASTLGGSGIPGRLCEHCFSAGDPKAEAKTSLMLTGAEAAGHAAGSQSAPLTPDPLSPSAGRGERIRKGCVL